MLFVDIPGRFYIRVSTKVRKLLKEKHTFVKRMTVLFIEKRAEFV